MSQINLGVNNINKIRILLNFGNPLGIGDHDKDILNLPFSIDLIDYIDQSKLEF